MRENILKKKKKKKNTNEDFTKNFRSKTIDKSKCLLRPYIDSEINHIRHFIKIPFIITKTCLFKYTENFASKN